MPTTPASGSARSAEVVNAEIRALWPRGPEHLDDERRREYEQLLAEWAAAVRAEVVKAA